MISKEQVLMYAQQGQSLPGWQVLHPKTSYLVRLAAIFAIMAIVVIGLGVAFLSQNSFVFVPGYSVGSLDPAAFQIWRYIDEAFLAILILILIGGASRYALELGTAPNQMLVLTPEGFLLKKRRAEQFVAYAGVTSITARASRYGDVTLNVKAVGGNAIYKVQLDGRYGNARALASQIIAAQRQYAAGQRAPAAQ